MKTKTIIIVLIAFVGCLMLAQDYPRGFRNPADVVMMTSLVSTSAPASTNLTNGLVAYWGFENDQSITNDMVSTNNLFPINGAETNVVAGIITNSFTNWTTSTKYFNLPHLSGANLNLTNNFSVSFWIRLNDVDGTQYFVSRFGITGNLRQWAVYFNNTVDRIQFIFSTNGVNTGNTLQYNTALSTVGWYHVVAVCSNLVPHLWVNLNATNGTTATGITNCASPFAIGGLDTANTELRGRIDEVGIWNRVITPTEITNLYNSGSGKQYPFN